MYFVHTDIYPFDVFGFFSLHRYFYMQLDLNFLHFISYVVNAGDVCVSDFLWYHVHRDQLYREWGPQVRTVSLCIPGHDHEVAQQQGNLQQGNVIGYRHNQIYTKLPYMCTIIHRYQKIHFKVLYMSDERIYVYDVYVAVLI